MDTSRIEAVKKDRLEDVMELLNNGADVNSTDSRKRTPLYYAARGGSLELVKEILGRGAEVNKKCRYDMTALHAACQFKSSPPNDNIAVVKLLLAKKADIDARDDEWRTPLYFASEGGHLQLVEALLEEGAEVNKQCKKGMTVLHAACRFKSSPPNDNIAVVKLLLAKKADIDARDDEWRTPLYFASEGGHLQLVEALLEEGAEVNKQCKKGMTVLHAACRFKSSPPNDNIAVVKLLLAKKADIDARDDEWRTPLYFASEGGHLQLVEALLEEGAEVNKQCKKGMTVLHAACRFKSSPPNDNIAVVKLLLAKKADIDARDYQMRTPLYFASEGGHLQLVEALLEEGADVNRRCGLHGTALQAAVKKENRQMVELLLNNSKTFVNSFSSEIGTALNTAACTGNLNIVKLLHEKGANINPPVMDAICPLIQATSRGYTEVVEFFLENRAIVNAYDSDTTALGSALFQGLMGIAKLLIEYGADVNAVHQGETELQTCTLIGHDKSVEFLLNHGADINAGYKNNMSPLEIAAKAGYTKIVRHLLKSTTEIKNLKPAMKSAEKCGNNEIAQLLRDFIRGKSGALS